MRASEIVQKFISALEKHQWETALSTLSRDFTFSGWSSQPLGKDDWLAISQALAAAMPDCSYGFTLLRERGSTVWGVIHFRGTHTRELALPLPGMPPIAPTYRQVVLPEEPVEFTMNEDGIRVMRMESSYGGGLPGILVALRAEQSAETPLSAPPTGPERVALVKEIPLRDPHSIEG